LINGRSYNHGNPAKRSGRQLSFGFRSKALYMAVVIFNFRGIVMCVVAFAIAFAIGAVCGLSGEGPLMIIAGPILAACDLAYRFGTKDGHWFSPDRGGSLFFLPAWCFGILWLVLGIVYVVNPEAA
jgi:hypothetical protein